MKILAIMGMALIVTGCGSITRGTKEDVAINVTPTNAQVQTSNGFACKNPCVIKVPRKDEFAVTASAPGYQSETVQVKTRVAGGGAASMAGNVLAGGVIGMGIDAANGAALDHYPNPVNIQLEPNGVPQVPVITDQSTPSGTATPVS